MPILPKNPRISPDNLAALLRAAARASAIPQELRDLPRWTCWQETPNGSGKPGKPPIQANIGEEEWRTGRHAYAKTNDPSTWASFDDALHYWQQHLKGQEPACGLNFVLNGDGIIGIDLDDCRDPAGKSIAAWALAIIQRFGSFTEISPSGTGIRIFIRGKLPAGGRHKGEIEVYDTGKFLSVTGHKLTGHGAHGIEDRSTELLAWHREVFGVTSTKENVGKNGHLVIAESPALDQARLRQLFAVKPKAKALHGGERNGHASQSEADLALANYATAAGWTAQETCNLLVAARHNAGEPIKPADYFERTVDKARKGRGDSKPSGLAAALKKVTGPGTDEIVIGPADSGGEIAETASMADVAKLVAGVKFLVRDWVPYGMLTMLLGEPGKGKSAFALYGLARPIITGCPWFSGAKGPAEPGKILWADTEATAAITIQRIKDWRLPAERILVPFKDDPLLSVDLMSAEHLQRIEGLVRTHQIKLVVIDSLRGAHDGDENNSRVGWVLKGLASIAERTSAAIVVIHHARKLDIDEDLTANASRGSNAIVGNVRSQLGIDKPDAQSDWCRLGMLKENLGLKPKPIGFRVTGKGLEFGEAPRRPQKETAKDRAEKFLLAAMQPGQQCAAADLIEKAWQQGISEATLNRAKTDLGIKGEKTKDGWFWSRLQGVLVNS